MGMLNKYTVMNKPIKKRNPLARVLWTAEFRKTIENKRVYKRRAKHQYRELVQHF